MTSASNRSQDRLLWGWETYFDEISFVRTADWQFGTANKGFSQYVIEKTHTCIVNVSSLRDHLRSSLNGVDGWSNNTRWSWDESAAIQCYVTLLSELLGTLTDTQLQAVVREIHLQHPSLGEDMVWGRIQARGTKGSGMLSEQQIHCTLHCVGEVIWLLVIYILWQGQTLYGTLVSIMS